MPPHLIVRRPSPTTVSFTVSNAPQHSSTSAKLVFHVQVIIRAIILCCVILVGVASIRHTAWVQDVSIIPWSSLWTSRLGDLACRVADSYSLKVVVPVIAAIVYGVFRKGYTEESLLVIRGLGIQTSTSSASYLSKAATRFIPTAQIQDIVIHEAFKGFEVRFYLAIIVEGEPDVVVVFPKLLSKRAILEEVWRGSRHCLYDGKL